MRKCAVCKCEVGHTLWQPELQQFYRPGYHERGFLAIPVGDQCIKKIEGGETVLFVWRKQDISANKQGIVATISPRDENSKKNS